MRLNHVTWEGDPRTQVCHRPFHQSHRLSATLQYDETSAFPPESDIELDWRHAAALPKLLLAREASYYHICSIKSPPFVSKFLTDILATPRLRSGRRHRRTSEQTATRRPTRVLAGFTPRFVSEQLPPQ